MKRVSFEIAKALKEAGYPQDTQEVYNENGERITSLIKYSNVFAAPYTMEVWLWLWREKKIPIDLCSVNNERWAYFEQGINTSRDGYIYLDPEEAIIAAIDAALEYLSNNK